VLGISVAYAKFRYFTAPGEARSAKGVAEQIRGLRQKGDLFVAFVRSPLEYFAQSTGHYALLTQRFVADGVLPAKPLNTVKFLLCYPIHRKIWPNKPVVLGVIITRDAMRFPSTNWGCGIAGHGAYEGGIPALMLYAFLLTFGIQLIDEPMRQQPGNPFLIYILAASVPNLMAIPRGDLGVMTVQVGHAILTAVILGWACRMIFGTSRAATGRGELRQSTNAPPQMVFHP
jgi:hypothetical protein